MRNNLLGANMLPLGFKLSIIPMFSKLFLTGTSFDLVGHSHSCLLELHTILYIEQGGIFLVAPPPPVGFHSFSQFGNHCIQNLGYFLSQEVHKY